MEETVVLQSREDTLAAAAPLFMDWLQQEKINLGLEGWMPALKALKIPRELIPMYAVPPDRDAETALIGVKLLLLARGLGVEMRPREWEVMYYRCGAADGMIRTRAETGEQFGVTRNRIGQIEEKLFRRIRAQLFRRSRPIRDFYV